MIWYPQNVWLDILSLITGILVSKGWEVKRCEASKLYTIEMHFGRFRSSYNNWYMLVQIYDSHFCNVSTAFDVARHLHASVIHSLRLPSLHLLSLPSFSPSTLRACRPSQSHRLQKRPATQFNLHAQHTDCRMFFWNNYTFRHRCGPWCAGPWQWSLRDPRLNLIFVVHHWVRMQPWPGRAG
jgi:hypothetical protein